MDLSLGSELWKIGLVHEGGKVGRSDATPIIFFSVDFFDLKFMLFKFGKDTFITFEAQQENLQFVAFLKAALV